MGSDLERYPEEGPVHEVRVGPFWMDEAPVTVGQFGRFVRSTGYVTVAELPLDHEVYPGLAPSLLVPGSLVFTPPARTVPLDDWRAWWSYVPGASWRAPWGPGTAVHDRVLHPVTHVCWADVQAYAQWAGRQIPSEAEWEFAARGGLRNAPYSWGHVLEPGGRRMANYWVGEFPRRDQSQSGPADTTPVRSFPPNGFGLFDVTGNVWEWTSNFHRPSHAAVADATCCGAAVDRRAAAAEDSYGPAEEGGARMARRTIKGGSFLCAGNYCARYRPAARQAQQIDSGMSHIGFRCILRRP